MPSKSLALGLLVVACVVAAASGAYIATRQNAESVQPQAIAQTAGSQDPVSSVPESKAAVTPAPSSAAASAQAAARTEAPELAQPASASASRRPAPAARERESVPAPRVEAEPPAAQPVAEVPPDSSAAAQPKPWPGGGASAPPATPPQPVNPPLPVESSPPREIPDPAPQQPEFAELIVPADSVLGLQLETSLNSERAQVEDRVDARVTRDVRVGNRVAIPAGTRVIGSVVRVGRGGKVKERAYLSIRFHTVVLADSSHLSINTDAISREGESPASKSAAKIGGAAVGGAILGAIIGGGKGAAIGSGIGAAGGTTAVMAGGRATVALPAGTLLTVRVLSPVTVTVGK